MPSKPLLRHLHFDSLVPFALPQSIQTHLSSLLLAHKASPTTTKDPIPTLLTFTPYPVYTLGRRDQLAPLSTAQTTQLTEPGQDGYVPSIVPTLRGGLTTFHGPGQVVLYPLLSLNSAQLPRIISPRCYVSLLEEATIRTLGRYGVTGVRTENPGVWVSAEEKVASLGVHLRRNVTGYGVGLNVRCGEWWERIVACGLEGRRMVGMSEVLARELEALGRPGAAGDGAAGTLGRSLRGLDEMQMGLVAETWAREFVDQIWGREGGVKEMKLVGERTLFSRGVTEKQFILEDQVRRPGRTSVVDSGSSIATQEFLEQIEGLIGENPVHGYLEEFSYQSKDDETRGQIPSLVTESVKDEPAMAEVERERGTATTTEPAHSSDDEAILAGSKESRKLQKAIKRKHTMTAADSTVEPEAENIQSAAHALTSEAIAGRGEETGEQVGRKQRSSQKLATRKKGDAIVRRVAYGNDTPAKEGTEVPIVRRRLSKPTPIPILKIPCRSLIRDPSVTTPLLSYYNSVPRPQVVHNPPGADTDTDAGPQIAARYVDGVQRHSVVRYHLPGGDLAMQARWAAEEMAMPKPLVRYHASPEKVESMGRKEARRTHELKGLTAQLRAWEKGQAKRKLREDEEADRAATEGIFLRAGEEGGVRGGWIVEPGDWGWGWEGVRWVR